MNSETLSSFSGNPGSRLRPSTGLLVPRTDMPVPPPALAEDCCGPPGPTLPVVTSWGRGGAFGEGGGRMRRDPQTRRGLEGRKSAGVM